MAISVKDIQEKEFATQAAGGYDVDQVDDFLDELANQFAAILRENLALSSQVKQLEGELSSAQAEKAELMNRQPDYNEGGYFKQLENAMRESLTGAQRIADKTVADAKAQAEQTIQSANAKADSTIQGANAQAETTIQSANAKAESTIESANAQAEKTVADANANAKSITEAAEKTLAELKSEAEFMRSNVISYRESLHKMLDEQLAILRASEEKIG